MDSTIIVSIKNVYGNEMIYPVSDNAVLLAHLAGTKTLTRAALQIIRSMGYDIKVEVPAL